jgi:hypothetical protein
VVLYAMWLGNEFIDNAAFPELLRDSAAQIAESRANAFRVHLLSRSRLLWLADLAASSLSRVTARERKDASLNYGPEPNGSWDDRYGNLYTKNVNLVLTRYAEPVYSERLALGVTRTEQAIRDMKALVGGRRLIIILMPFKEQEYSDIVDRLRPGLAWDRPNTPVREMCERNAVECWDVTGAIRAHRDERLYWDYDPHFTPRGQLHAANEVERLMTQAQLLP